jgi:DNA-binding protein YbaB
MADAITPRALMEVHANLANERIESAIDDVTVVISGSYQVLEVRLNRDSTLDSAELEKALVTALNDALARVAVLIGERVQALQ